MQWDVETLWDNDEDECLPLRLLDLFDSADVLVMVGVVSESE